MDPNKTSGQSGSRFSKNSCLYQSSITAVDPRDRQWEILFEYSRSQRSVLVSHGKHAGLISSRPWGGLKEGLLRSGSTYRWNSKVVAALHGAFMYETWPSPLDMVDLDLMASRSLIPLETIYIKHLQF